jgi:hypothetical protein
MKKTEKAANQQKASATQAAWLAAYGGSGFVRTGKDEGTKLLCTFYNPSIDKYPVKR